jgi:hypothetical protein
VATVTAIGPVANLRYSARALAYLGGSPSPQQSRCIVDFLMLVKISAVRAPAIKLLGRDILLVGACGHIIEFRRNGTAVHDITPVVLP